MFQIQKSKKTYIKYVCKKALRKKRSKLNNNKQSKERRTKIKLRKKKLSCSFINDQGHFGHVVTVWLFFFCAVNDYDVWHDTMK